VVHLAFNPFSFCSDGLGRMAALHAAASAHATPALRAVHPQPGGISRNREEARRLPRLAFALAVPLQFQARIKRVYRRCKPGGISREQAQQIVNDRAALRMGGNDLETLVSEEDREKLTEKADTLEAYRQYVYVAAFGLILGAGYDLLWLVFQPSFFTKGLLPSGSTDDSQVSRLLVVAGLAAVGAGLYYVASVILAPAELPSVETVLRAEEGEEAIEDSVFYRLQGRWFYGMNLGQSYTISKSPDGTWRFEEELAGKKCSSTLRVVGDWVEGQLLDQDGQQTGTIRLQRGEGNSIFSYIREVGSVNWSNPNEAIGW